MHNGLNNWKQQHLLETINYQRIRIHPSCTITLMTQITKEIQDLNAQKI